MANPTQNLVQRGVVVVLLGNLGQRLGLALEVGARCVHYEVDRIAQALISSVGRIENLVSRPVQRGGDLVVGVGVSHASSWHGIQREEAAA